MLKFINQFHENYQPKVEPYIDKAETLDEIFFKIKNNNNIDLKSYKYHIVERVTKEGFNLKFHRDNYLIRKFKDGYKWLPYDLEELPIYSLIWYRNDKFTGGELVLYPNKIIKPSKNMFVFIDSNSIHKVNVQNSGIREIKLFKFYN